MDSNTSARKTIQETIILRRHLRDFDDVSVWLGLVAPKGTPKLIIDKINREVVRIPADPAVRQKFDQSGNFAVSSTPEEFEAFIHKEANRWSKVLADLDIKYD